MRVVGNACGLGIEGSGWVAAPGLVVTNAHVVAGIRTPHVDRSDGDLLDARVVSFDRVNDIAVLRVAGLKARPLPLADAAEGTPGGLLGYPGNGPYTETAVRVGRVVRIVGRDAYGTFPTSRQVTTIRGEIRSGNSGGPVVDAQGRVITTVFAQRAAPTAATGCPRRSSAPRSRRPARRRSRRPASTAEVTRRTGRQAEACRAADGGNQAGRSTQPG